MAVTQPLTWRQQIFGAKIETTTGTEIALATGDTAYNAADVSVEPDIPGIRRQGQYSDDALKTVPGGKGARISARIEFCNSDGATAPLSFSTMLTACGFTISGSVATLAIGAATLNNLTVGQWVDGWKFFAIGCMFNPEFLFEAGNIPQASLEGMGCWGTPIAEALPSFTAPGGTPPICAGSTLTVNSVTTYVSPRAVIRPQCQVALRQDSSSASGYKAAFIGHAEPQWEIDVELEALATTDWYALHAAKTSFAGSLAVGTGTNGILTFASPALIQNQPPQKFDKDGVAMLKLVCDAVRSTANGGDSLTITRS